MTQTYWLIRFGLIFVSSAMAAWFINSLTDSAIASILFALVILGGFIFFFIQLESMANALMKLGSSIGRTTHTGAAFSAGRIKGRVGDNSIEVAGGLNHRGKWVLVEARAPRPMDRNLMVSSNKELMGPRIFTNDQAFDMSFTVTCQDADVAKTVLNEQVRDRLMRAVRLGPVTLANDRIEVRISGGGILDPPEQAKEVVENLCWILDRVQLARQSMTAGVVEKADDRYH